MAAMCQQTGPCNFNPRFPRGKRPLRDGDEDRPQDISIHASRGGSDGALKICMSCLSIFQSTLPAGEATCTGSRYLGSQADFNPRFPRGKRRNILASASSPRPHFNPRFPRGKRLKAVNGYAHTVVISIHASRGGSDKLLCLHSPLRGTFQSTLPAGEATVDCSDTYFNLKRISIHASRGGSDSTVKLSPDDRTKQHGFREPGFSGFLSAVSMLFFFWALGVRAYRIMVSLGSYPFFVPI